MYSIIKCTPVVFKARPRLGSYGFDANKLNNGLYYKTTKSPIFGDEYFSMNKSKTLSL